MKVPRWLYAAMAATLAALIAGHFRSTPYNNYVLLADAWLHGHAWIVWPGPYIDALAYHGEHYVIEGPVPALLLLPYVALAGINANQTLLAAILAGVAIGAAWELGERLGVASRVNLWLCLFFLAGTSLLWCASLGDVWFIAHVSTAAFTMLALVELCGWRRGWLVALWAVAAAGSRFSLALAIPVYVVLLLMQSGEFFTSALPAMRLKGVIYDRARAVSFSGFAGVLIVAGLAYVAYNFARWGTAADIGYVTWYHQDSAGSPTGSPFRFEYLTYQLWSFFVQAPAFMPKPPWIIPSYSGIALTWTSPALILALLAVKPRGFVAALWIAASVTAAPSFFYYVNGFAQYGMRHALDFEPFLLALMMIAARGRLALWAQALIVYSCAACSYGVWYWNGVLRPGN